MAVPGDIGRCRNNNPPPFVFPCTHCHIAPSPLLLLVASGISLSLYWFSRVCLFVPVCPVMSVEMKGVGCVSGLLSGLYSLLLQWVKGKRVTWLLYRLNWIWVELKFIYNSFKLSLEAEWSGSFLWYLSSLFSSFSSFLLLLPFYFLCTTFLFLIFFFSWSLFSFPFLLPAIYMPTLIPSLPFPFKTY